VWTINTLSLNSWVGEAYVSILLENGYIPRERDMAKHYRENLFFEQDAIIIQKYKKYTKKKRSRKAENLKGSPGKI